MVNPCQALPHEVWINILNQVEDKKQLATCRLVCKQWDPIAEKAMFSKELDIYYNEGFVAKLHYHLTKKPALTLLIKDIRVFNAGYNDKPNLLYNELLKLVMTASLEKVDGWFPTEDSKQLFYQIILNSPHKFNKIKEIPLDRKSNLYNKCLYAIKESLEDMRLTICDGESTMIPDHLHQFPKLNYFEFTNYHFRNIEKLDLILGRLQCATELVLVVGFRDENYISKSSEEMNAWLVQNVKIDERMKSLFVVSSLCQNHWCNLVEYLVYKYPNLHHFSIDDMTLDSEIEGILQATKHNTCFALKEIKCDSLEHLWTVGYMMKSPSNTVKIGYSFYVDTDDKACKIEKACREDETATTGFEIELRNDTSHAYIKQFLSSVASGTSMITEAMVDLVHWRDQDNSQDY